MTTKGPRWRALGLGLLVVLIAAGVAVFLWIEKSLPARRAACSTRRSPSDATRRRFRPPTKTTSTTWTAVCRSRPRRSRDGTRGPSGPPATIASGTGLATTAYGALDFLKTMSTHPSLKTSRDRRWEYLGLVNEPCFVKPTGPDPKRYGLWLDQRSPDCPPDPFENEQKYPGVAIGARGKTIERRLLLRVCHGHRRAPAVSQSRVRRTGREGVGSRIATTPIPRITTRNKLVRPYRVGMSCGFCHVGPNPTKPPADPENPKWENLSSNVGAQYFWVDRIFDWDADPVDFVVPAVSHVAPGYARHLADLDRQHQQPAHDERGLPAAAAAAAGEALGQGNARRRRAGQPAVQRFREGRDR